MKNLKVGEKVTCKQITEAYYSNYGISPKCSFTPNDIGIIGSVNVPYVNKQGTFTCVDFEKYGQKWRVSLDNKNIVNLA